MGLHAAKMGLKTAKMAPRRPLVADFPRTVGAGPTEGPRAEWRRGSWGVRGSTKLSKEPNLTPCATPLQERPHLKGKISEKVTARSEVQSGKVREVQKSEFKK